MNTYHILYFTGGIDFVILAQQVSFTQSGQTQCVNVSILKDRVDEPNEIFLLDLTLNYAAFNIPLTTLSVTILDSGELSEFTFAGASYLKSGV